MANKVEYGIESSRSKLVLKDSKFAKMNANFNLSL